MPRRIQGPDGKIHEFPDDFTDADVSAALESVLPPSQASAPAGPEGSAVGRFASNAWEVLNPINMATGVYNAVTSPVETGKAVFAGQANQLQKARQAFAEGRYSEALGHGAATALPIVGPLAAEAGEQIGAGDYAGGAGKAFGILAPFGMAEGLAKLGVKVTPNVVADRLDAAAAARVADVMSPKSSAAKGLRMTAKAEKIAPTIAAGDNAAWSRAGLRENLAEKLTAAKAALNEADELRNGAAPHETAPILKELRAKRAQLVAEPFDATYTTPEYRGQGARTATPDTEFRVSGETGLKADQVPPHQRGYRDLKEGARVAEPERSGAPLGTAQVPAPNRARVAVLDKAIAEIEALGPIAPYDALRTIRKAYDGPAEVRYNPAVTPDFLANQSNAMASADVAGAIRETLAKGDPTTAAANADFSLYKSAHDIVTAAEELEKARPKNGRRLMSQLTGSLIGSEAGGTTGAVAGYALGPIVDNALTAGFTTKLKTAQVMTDFAKAIRSGDTTRAASLSFKLRQLAKQAEVTRAKEAPVAQPQAQ